MKGSPTPAAIITRGGQVRTRALYSLRSTGTESGACASSASRSHVANASTATNRDATILSASSTVCVVATFFWWARNTAASRSPSCRSSFLARGDARPGAVIALSEAKASDSRRSQARRAAPAERRQRLLQWKSAARCTASISNPSNGRHRRVITLFVMVSLSKVPNHTEIQRQHAAAQPNAPSKTTLRGVALLRDRATAKKQAGSNTSTLSASGALALCLRAMR